MTMRLEQEPEGENPRQRAFAGVIVGIRHRLFDRKPLPSVTIPEKPLEEIKSFSPEQRKALEKQGFVIYALTGQSIETLRNSGRKIRPTWHRAAKCADFETLSSMRGEVAINPSKPFLPRSDRKTLAQQEKMVEKFSQKLEKKVTGVRAIIGQAPDYAELAFAHFDSTQKYLFGQRENYDYTRTKTSTGISRVAGIGNFIDLNVGLNLIEWYTDDGLAIMYAAPLVVPV